MNKTNKIDFEKLYKEVKAMTEKDCVEIHRVMGDEIRYSIFKEIVLQPGITGKELLVKFQVSQPTLSFHIAQLTHFGLVNDVRDGQSHTYYPEYGKIISYYKALVWNKEIAVHFQKIFEVMAFEGKTKKEPK